MGILTRVLEKSGYELDMKIFEEPPAEVKFELVEEDAGATGNTTPPGKLGVGKRQRRRPIESE